MARIAAARGASCRRPDVELAGDGGGDEGLAVFLEAVHTIVGTFNQLRRIAK